MRHFIAVAVACFVVGSAGAQGTRADFDRAGDLAKRVQKTVIRDRVVPHWLEGGDQFWYRVDTTGGGWEYVFVDAGKGVRRPAFNHVVFSEKLTRELGRIVSADKLPIEAVKISESGRLVRFRADGKYWRFTVGDNRMSADEPRDELVAWLDSPRNSSSSGGAARILFVNQRDQPVQLAWIDPQGARKKYGEVPAKGQREFPSYHKHVWEVTDDGDRPLGWAMVPEDGGRLVIPADRAPVKPATRGEGNLTSPDGKYQIRFRTTPGDDRKVHLIESTPKDGGQPKLHTLNYAKPGDKLAVRKPYLFAVDGSKEITVSDSLFPNPFAINHVRWQADSSRFTFLYNQRGHQLLRVIGVDTTGQARTIIEETSPTFIDYSGKFYLHFTPSGNEAIWMSERDGWNHLYLYDTLEAKVRNQITKGPWAVRSVDRVDDEKRQIWFRASGMFPDQDPYHVHFGRVGFDGNGLTWLTSADGTHEVEWSPGGKWLIDTHSRVDRAAAVELRRGDTGQLVCPLEQADWSALRATGWQTPERFVAPGRDGKTPIHGVIFRPSNFDPAKKYPVIEQVYAGPQSSYVPRQFRHWHGTPQYLAELGFIVVQADGMGTSHRSKSFHDVCWKNLGDAGFPDRIAWIRAAAAKYPQLDLSRVGTYGGSAGGQNAVRALIAHGDFYKVAVADCGCHDNRMDKVWWNEQWMGWPVGPHYAEQSNVTQAHKLQGKLLLTVGELDRNVDPASTMQVVDALVRADKDFELLVVPGAGHGAGETPYAARRRADFFVRHLMGVEPRR
ncbi:MAG: prolyl oligopeptidase family serine peptidase [Gemmataceae bacterium]|nr:prolyl oligopeptidase family serine peptidase [Gemmataceae bacterium]